jgi:glycosyltransferase involved in cell wall biosynthesis
LKLVPLGVDTAFYQPVFDGRRDYILAGGRDNGRDYKTVIEVARLLPKREFQIFMSRRNLAGIENIPPNVKIFFDIPLQEVRVKYAEAAMLLLITHADGHGDGADCSGQTVLLDAFASGLPVIASRKAYVADYAVAGREYLPVDFYSPSDIIRAIGEMPAKAASLSHAARQRVEKDFSSVKMGANLSRIFESCL